VSTPAEVVAAAIRARGAFLVTSHARPDGDAIGSSLALALALERLDKRVRVILRDPTPLQYADFPAVDRIERIDRVDAAVDAADAAVVLECSDISRPGVAGLEQYFVINVDHHVGNEMYGAVDWFDPSAAACGEMVADIVDALGVAWTPEMAAHLFLAVSTDTGGFRYGPISARTFEICRRVAETGVNTALLSRQIFDSFSIGRIRLTGAILNAMELHHGSRVALLSFDDELLARCGATIDDTEGLVNLPLGAREVVAVALLKRHADDIYRVSLRSKGAVDVRAVAARWSGGGHQNAAGCTLTGSYETVRDAIVAALGEAVDGLPAATVEAAGATGPQ
jgi:bifunctional oligoribonuclease and PAP phosphatase NrnA